MIRKHVDDLWLTEVRRWPTFVLRYSYFKNVVLKARPHVFLGGVVLHGRYASAHVGELLGLLAVPIGGLRAELVHAVAIGAKAVRGFHHRAIG